MELNETEKFAVETSRMVRTYFDQNMDSSSIRHRTTLLLNLIMRMICASSSLF